MAEPAGKDPLSYVGDPGNDLTFRSLLGRFPHVQGVLGGGGGCWPDGLGWRVHARLAPGGREGPGEHLDPTSTPAEPTPHWGSGLNTSYLPFPAPSLPSGALRDWHEVADRWCGPAWPWSPRPTEGAGRDEPFFGTIGDYTLNLAEGASHDTSQGPRDPQPCVLGDPLLVRTLPSPPTSLSLLLPMAQPLGGLGRVGALWGWLAASPAT